LKTRAAVFIAFRYLLGRAREGGRYLRGAAAGIALSLVPIIVTLIVADGMIRGITDRYLELGTGHLQVYDYIDSRNPYPALDGIRGLKNFRGVWEEAHGLGILVGSSASRGATIRAVDKSFFEDEGSRKFLTVISGEAALGSGREVLLGEELASSIGASPGSTIRIMTVRTGNDGRIIPGLASFTVRGIVSSGYRELDSLWCIMSFEEGMKILPDTTPVYLTVKISDPYTGADAAADHLYNVLEPSFGVYTWKSLQRSQYNSYESTRQLLLFIMALIVLIAAVNVSSATSMLAIERRHDIAILKTGGAASSFTSRIFLWSAFLTGLIGSVIGICAGLLIGVNINGILYGLEIVLSLFTAIFNGEPVRILNSGYYLETIPIIINVPVVIIIGISTVFCSVLASWIPANRAGKLKPIEILRKN